LPAERTLQRWLATAGLTRRRLWRRHVVLQRGVAPTPARHSNHVWTIDLKGWFRTHDGSKIEPLTVRDLASRFVLCTQPLASRGEPTVRRVCARLFRRYGRPRVIRCDRGAPFFGDGPHGFTRLSLWWWRLGIRVEFVRRGRINNNAHEQMHAVLQAELVIAATPIAQARALARWRKRYNEARPHDALGLRTPASLYRPRPTPLPDLHVPTYPAAWLVRPVRRSGGIYLPGWRGTIGRAFGGLPVGLKPIGPQSYHVYFGTLLLGELDLRGRRKLMLTPA
jgi:Integrase core domain.